MLLFFRSRRVAVKAPYELRRHPEATRRAWLAVYAHLRGRAVTDTLVDLLPAPKAAWEIETVRHIGARAENRVGQELLDHLKRVGGKQALLCRIADAAVERPDCSMRELLCPVVGEQTLRGLVREAKATGPTYRTTLRATIRSSYRGHYRRTVLDLLAALDFRSNNEAQRPVIQALDLVRRHAGTRLQAYLADEDAPMNGVVRPLWRDAVVDRDPQGRPRVNRIACAICALEALREQLRCKEVWVAGADRYRNPDEDLPADFDAAASIIAEIGTDMDVFASARRLAAWAGVAPGNYESAGKPKGAGTRRGNVFLKSALFAAASAAVRTKGSYYRDKYNRLRARRGPVRAIMAIAHKLLIAAFHMLSTGEAFRDLGEGYLGQVARKRSTAKLVQRLSSLGYDVMLVPKAA